MRENGFLWVLMMLICLLVGAALLVAGKGYDRTTSAINSNAHAIQYICSTTSVLDSLVSQQAAQLKANFKNGTYTHLLKQHIIKPELVAQARKTLVQFERSHEKLTEHSACRDSHPTR